MIKICATCRTPGPDVHSIHGSQHARCFRASKVSWHWVDRDSLPHPHKLVIVGTYSNCGAHGEKITNDPGVWSYTKTPTPMAMDDFGTLTPTGLPHD